MWCIDYLLLLGLLGCVTLCLLVPPPTTLLALGILLLFVALVCGVFEYHGHISEVGTVATPVPVAIAILNLLYLISDVEFKGLKFTTIQRSVIIVEYHVILSSWPHITAVCVDVA